MTRCRSKFLLPLLVMAVTSCGTSATAIHGSDERASIKLTLNTVRTIRSVTVSPGKAILGDCQFGSAVTKTHSTADRLGFPNGICWFGAEGSKYPILIKNTGVASNIEIFGGNAIPSNGGTSWSLCNVGNDPLVACTGAGDLKPGLDQYLLRNFSQNQPRPYAGLSNTPQCDRQFDESHTCWAVHGQFQNEGVELIGPSMSSDSSVTWTVAITWMPTPP